MAQTVAFAGAADRPSVSVFWAPGCSSCLKLKEFVEEQELAFESVNVHERPDGLDEIVAAGLRGVPVIRRGTTYMYAQNLDEVAALLEVRRHHSKLAAETLVQRWGEILGLARDIVEWFPEAQLARNAIWMRDRSIMSLCGHIFQIPHTFLLMLEGSVGSDREAMTRPRATIVTRWELLAYVDQVVTLFDDWRRAAGAGSIPARMMTYYGDQTSAQVLERGVWHSAQHARQLDTVAAGMGAEFHIPPSLYDGLPMPQRLWA